jgi:hypothetical protein
MGIGLVLIGVIKEVFRQDSRLVLRDTISISCLYDLEGLLMCSNNAFVQWTK